MVSTDEPSISVAIPEEDEEEADEEDEEKQPQTQEAVQEPASLSSKSRRASLRRRKPSSVEASAIFENLAKKEGAVLGQAINMAARLVHSF